LSDLPSTPEVSSIQKPPTANPRSLPQSNIGSTIVAGGIVVMQRRGKSPKELRANRYNQKPMVIKKLSWRTKLISLFVGILIVSLIIQILYVIPSIHDQEKEKVKAYQEQTTASIVRHLDIDLAKVKITLLRVPLLPGFHELDMDDMADSIQAFMKVSQRVSRVAVLDSKGEFLFGRKEDFIGTASIDYKDKPYFTRPFNNGQIHLDPPRYYEDDGLIAASMCLPIESETGERIGVFVGVIDITNITEMITEYSLAEGQIAYIIDKEGQIIAHSNIDLLSLEDGPLSLKPNCPLIKLQSDSKEIESMEHLHEGISYLGSSGFSEITGWKVVVEASMNSILAETDAMIKKILITDLLLFLVGIIITVFFSRQIITAQMESEKTLQKNEEKYRAIFENTGTSTCIIEKDSTLSLVNSMFETMSGYSRKEVEGKMKWPEFVHPDDLVMMKEQHKLRRENAESALKAYEFRFIGPNKKIKDVYLTVDIIPGTTQSVASLLDITERKKAVSKIRELSKTVETASQTVVITDLEANIIYVNQSCIETCGVEGKEELIGKSLSLFTDKEGAGLLENEAFPKLLSKGVWMGRLNIRRSDGSYFPAEILASVTEDEHGKTEHIIGKITDISELKKTEDALREMNQLLNKAEEFAHLGSWSQDMATNQLSWTEEVFRIFGMTPQKDKISADTFLEAVHPDDLLFVNNAYKESIEKGLSNYETEHRIIRQDTGEIRFVHENCFHEKNASEKPVRLVGMVQDITDRKLAEAEQSKLQSQLGQAQKMESIGQLAGGVAHDFNNMLGVILGHAEMALDQLDPAHLIYEDLEKIQKAALRSADLTRQLLAFASRQLIEPKVLMLNDTLLDMLTMLQRLIGEDVKLTWIPESDLWPVKMDPSQIDQILANLCVNARDAIEGVGEVIIKTSNTTVEDDYCACHDGCLPGEYVRLEVSDNGSGMDKKILSHLFEPFFTSKPLGEGTGLGLATVYGIMKQNKGFINVTSKPGEGSTFRIYMPRFVGEIKPEEKTRVTVKKKTGTETILLVEDEVSLLKLTVHILRGLGYTVLTADSPQKALQLFEENQEDIHLLMTDVVMPEMNGRDLWRKLSSMRTGLKCLFVSGYTADIIAQRGELEDGVPFLQKPYQSETLAAKLRQILDSDEA
jgi:PAS domain S-box-containing protein